MVRRQNLLYSLSFHEDRVLKCPFLCCLEHRSNGRWDSKGQGHLILSYLRGHEGNGWFLQIREKIKFLGNN